MCFCQEKIMIRYLDLLLVSEMIIIQDLSFIFW